jgi:Disulphide bond corrector protein DsbC
VRRHHQSAISQSSLRAIEKTPHSAVSAAAACFCFSLLSFIFVPAGLWASADFVSVASVAPVTVAAGKPAVASLKFRVQSGFHINSNHPNSELLIPTRLKLNPPTDVGIGRVTYPAGKDISLTFAPDEKLNVFSGEFKVDAVVSAVRGASPGHYAIHGELAYQACDDRACYPPKKLPVTIAVTVVKSRIAGSGHRRANPGQSPHIH